MALSFFAESKGKKKKTERMRSNRGLMYKSTTGAAGIIFPHIDTPEQAAEAVSKCRYAHPDSTGDRSLSPCALIPGVTDMAPPGSSHERVADSHIAVICQIESPVCLVHLTCTQHAPKYPQSFLSP